MAETWRSVVGYEGYEVSDLGAVRSFRNNRWGLTDTPHLLAQKNLKRPHAAATYKQVRLGTSNHIRVHQLVMAAFVGPCPPGLMVRHLNGDGTDNRLSNLAYGTASENAHDTVAHGLNAWANRTHCGQGHPFAGDNLLYRANGGRVCRECRRQASVRNNARRKGRAA